MRPSSPYLVIARGLVAIIVLGGADGGEGGAMEAIWRLLIGGGLAGVRVFFLAGGRSSDFRPMFGSWFLA